MTDILNLPKRDKNMNVVAEPPQPAAPPPGQPEQQPGGGEA